MREDEAAPTSVILYMKKGCSFSASLRRDLTRRRLPFEMVDIRESAAGMGVVLDATGGAEVTPVVAVGEITLVNPSGRDVVRLVQTTASHLLPPDDADASRGWLDRAWSRLGRPR